MANLTAHLPVEQAVACYAALVKAVNEAAVSPDPVTRNRGQIMADTFVERITGQTVASDVNIEVQVLVPLEALLDPASPLPAEIPGYGPIEADLIATSTGRKTLRRLLTHDGVDHRRRLTPTHLHRQPREVPPSQRRQPLLRTLLRRPSQTHRPHTALGRRREERRSTTAEDCANSTTTSEKAATGMCAAKATPSRPQLRRA